LAAVRELYPTVVEDARVGHIATPWHPINVQQGTDDQQIPVQHTAGSQPSAFQTTTALRKVYFIRFDVRVVGGNPWRVRVEGYASSWKAGEIPTPLKGAEIPPWLEGRVNALEVAIYRRLKQYAVPLRYRSGDDEQKKAPPPLDVAKYGSIPADAATVIGKVEQAAAARDVAALRPLMADEFTFSLGEAPSADTAIAVWQADSAALVELGKALSGGCAEDPQSQRIVCPTRFFTEQGYLGYRAGFARVDGAWKMIFFVAGD